MSNEHGPEPEAPTQETRVVCESTPDLGGGEVLLAEESITAIASCVVALLRVAPDAHSKREWIDAQELARLLGVRRNTVYAKAEELGAIRIGSGPRARLRFPASAAASLRRDEPARRTHRKSDERRRRVRRSSGHELLPLRGQRSAPGAGR